MTYIVEEKVRRAFCLKGEKNFWQEVFRTENEKEAKMMMRDIKKTGDIGRIRVGV